MNKNWIIAIVVVVVVLAIVFRNNIMAMFSKSPSAPTAPAPTGGGQNTQPTQLDYNKNLYKGLNNSNEVKLLQQWLGITADGDFGPVTENALLNRKGVKQITLNQYQQLADAQPVETDDPNDHWYNHLPWPFNSFADTSPNLMQSGITGSVGWVEGSW